MCYDWYMLDSTHDYRPNYTGTMSNVEEMINKMYPNCSLKAHVKMAYEVMVE